jgi:rhamnose transport system permease protein
MSALKLGMNNFILMIALMAICGIMSLLSPFFLTLGNLLEATRFVAEIGFVALGMTIVMFIGGIDLSVGSIFALTAVITGGLAASGFPPLASLILALAVGTVAGGLNGLLVSKVNIPPIIVTLSTMAVYRGIAIGISTGHSYRMPKSLYFLGQSYVAKIPLQFIILLIVTLLLTLLVKYTPLGRTLLALGNNEEASRFSGLQVDRVKIIAFAISGFLSAFAALVYSSRVISAKADFGIGYELDAITISVLGGTSLSGGRVNILGTVLGGLIIVMTRRGLTMALVPSEIQSIFIGVILIVSVALNKFFAVRRSA